MSSITVVIIVSIARSGYELSSTRVNHLRRAYWWLNRGGRLLSLINFRPGRLMALLDWCRLFHWSCRSGHFLCGITGASLI